MIKKIAVSTFLSEKRASEVRRPEVERMKETRNEKLSPEVRALLERLFNDPEINFTEQQLEDMLDEELNKPLEEIDMKLVDDLLACLEPREVTEEEINRGLAKLQEAFRRLESNE